MPLSSRRIRIQPRGYAEIDYRHPLARDLRFFIVPSRGGFIDLVHQLPGTIIFGSPTIGGYPGSQTSLAAQSPFGYSFADQPDYRITSDLSLLWGGLIKTGNANRQFVDKHASGPGTSNNSFELRTDNAATPTPTLVRASGGSFNVYTSSPISLNQFHQVGVRAPDDGVSTVVFYNDNVELDTGTAGIHGAADDGSPIRVGIRADSAVVMDGYTEYVMGWARSLTKSEFAALYDNPYQMLKVAPSRFYMNTPATAFVFNPMSGRGGNAAQPLAMN